MSKTVGSMEEKSDKKGNRFYNLEINLPFAPKMEFYVAENTKKIPPKPKTPHLIILFTTHEIR